MKDLLRHTPYAVAIFALLAIFGVALDARPASEPRRMDVETVDIDESQKKLIADYCVGTFESQWSLVLRDFESWRDQTRKDRDQCNERLVILEDRVKALEDKHKVASAVASKPSGGSSGTVVQTTYQSIPSATSQVVSSSSGSWQRVCDPNTRTCSQVWVPSGYSTARPAWNGILGRRR